MKCLEDFPKCVTQARAELKFANFTAQAFDFCTIVACLMYCSTFASNLMFDLLKHSAQQCETTVRQQQMCQISKHAQIITNLDCIVCKVKFAMGCGSSKSAAEGHLVWQIAEIPTNPNQLYRCVNFFQVFAVFCSFICSTNSCWTDTFGKFTDQTLHQRHLQRQKQRAKLKACQLEQLLARQKACLGSS